MEQISSRARGRYFLDLRANLFERGPIAAIGGNFAKRNPGIGHVGANLRGGPPFAFRLVDASFREVRHSQLVMAKSIRGIIFDRLLQSLQRVVGLGGLQQDLPFQDQCCVILRCALENLIRDL